MSTEVCIYIYICIIICVRWEVSVMLIIRKSGSEIVRGGNLPKCLPAMFDAMDFLIRKGQKKNYSVEILNKKNNSRNEESIYLFLEFFFSIFFTDFKTLRNTTEFRYIKKKRTGHYKRN